MTSGFPEEFQEEDKGQGRPERSQDMKHSDIIIIGGGAAGLMAAAGAAGIFRDNGCGKTVTVLEKMPRPGRKIMITGKGRCNITNTRQWNEFSGHIHPKANCLKHAFFNLDTAKTIEFFNRNGLDTVVERGDRVFPASHSAADVVDTLVKAVTSAGAYIETGNGVSEIHVTANRDENSGRPEFTIKCRNGNEYSCSRLVIATGGLSYPGTGSTGDGYIWARQFKHTVRTCFPSLTAVVPEGYKILSGNGQSSGDTSHTPGQDAARLRGHIDRALPLSDTGSALNGNQIKNISLTLFIDGHPVQEEFGDIDFTDGGIEGPAGFRISRRCVCALSNGAKASVSIDLKPAVEETALDKRINALWQEIATDRRSQGKTYDERFRVLLGKLLPLTLVPGFIRCNRNIDHKTLARRLKNWRMDIRGYVGYERCVITAGGVATDEISPKTMESKICPGLYFAGEILDMDGDTGGYNLQTAFSTGMLAGQSAADSLI